MDVVQWLYQLVPCGLVMQPAADNGNLSRFIMLHLHAQTTTTVTTSTWTKLQRNRTEGCTIKALQAAADRGNRKLFVLLRAHNTSENVLVNMDNVAANGHLDMLEYLHEHDATCTTDAMDLAAGNGHFEIVQWLDVMRMEGCTAKAMNMAAGRGDLTMVEYLVNTTCKKR
ncbi:Aste57867_17531 [Aphanomyces stellatus]|uniref:Aste57867_17531 protein n=1 Tax=Aphanomyces stellatus TaxID=120398 RepID=A0A485L9N8_9STRA|nr:hypothetical protein As57867_017471 [Aphanomyces stellatus]VFT94284.1 Aste57867_17531 [Aphanomyces stellatus]